MGIERRQFPRLKLSDIAFAVDDQGRELGKVSQASGGGMLIKSEIGGFASIKAGDHLRLTIMEPGSKASNTIEVTVRYVDGAIMGLEFVTGKSG